MDIKIEKMILKNFKSFKKGNVLFSDGFSVIGGPNGSGKSNIIDAICFVLGTGSMKNLRASRLTDLVNSKSKNDSAEVSIYLKENDEKYKVTRIIDKKGKGNYKLNNKNTSKTALIQFLRSKGISPNGYNIIMQGDVEGIIKMNHRQRRQIIDEVAGIAEYDEKKEEALKELLKVESKVSDANLITSQKEGGIEQLKIERDDAIKYTELKTRLKRAKVTVMKEEFNVINDKNETLKKKISVRDERMGELEKNRQEFNEELGEKERELSEINKEILEKGEKNQIELSKLVDHARTQLRITESEVNSKKETIEKGNEKIKELSEQTAELDKSFKGKKNELSQKEKDLQKLNSMTAKKDADLAAAISMLESKNTGLFEVQKTVEELAKKIDEKTEENNKIKIDSEALKERIQLKQEHLNELSGNNAEKEKSTEELNEKHSNLASAEKSLNKKISKLEAEISDLFQQEKKMNSEFEKNERDLNDARDKLTSLRAKYRAYKDAGIGPTPAIKLLNEAKEKGLIQGIHGTIAELCEYDAKYAGAIEAAAGGRMFFEVVRDDNVAAECINFLKKKNAGRVTFIPLNKIRSRKLSAAEEACLTKQGAIDVAINLIDFNPGYLKAFENVFGTTLIVDDLTAMKRIGVGSARMVTIEGDISELSGTMSGGSKRKSGVSLVELKKIDELDAKTTEFESVKRNLLSQLEFVRSCSNNKREEKNSREIELKGTQVEEKTISEMILQRQHSSSGNRIDKLKSEISKIKSEMEKKKELQKKAEFQLKELRDKRALNEKKLEKSRDSKDNKAIEKERTELEKLKEEKTALVVEIESLKSEVEKVYDAKNQSFSARIDDITDENELLSDEIKKRTEESDKIKEELKKNEAELDKVSGAMHKLNLQKTKLANELEEKSRSCGKINQELTKLEREINNFRIEKARIETRLEDLLAESGMEKESEDEEIKPLNEPVKKLVEEIPKIEDELRSLEPVNLRAIDSYDEQKKELEYMKEKITQLSDEKKAILQMMDSIESNRYEVFMKTFNKVNENFKKIFKKMANGEGELSLENASDPLETGLTISAQPSGKEIKNLDSMSGGEKALTALTFVFAIHLSEPAPFYILDEADAPLDKVNSEKLGEMIKEFSCETQFIAISHNDTMFRSANQVIGVALNGGDGSSVLGLPLRDHSQPPKKIKG